MEIPARPSSRLLTSPFLSPHRASSLRGIQASPLVVPAPGGISQANDKITGKTGPASKNVHGSSVQFWKHLLGLSCARSCAVCVCVWWDGGSAGLREELGIVKAHCWQYSVIGRAPALGSGELGSSCGLGCFLAGDFGQVS